MICPVKDRVCVEKEPQPPLMVGGILIPEVCERTPRFAPAIYAQVLGVGAETRQAIVMQRVIVKVYGGDDWLFEGKTITIIRERDLIGIFNMNKIQPIGSRVLMQHLEQKEEIRGGIYIPENAKEKPQEAIVIAVGPDCKEVKQGNKVLISKYGSTEVKLGDEKYALCKEEDLLAVIK